MKVCAKTGTTVVEVSVTRDNGYYVVELDGEVHKVDAVKLEDDFFTVLNGSKSYEVSVEARRDGYHGRHGAAQRLGSFVEPGRSDRRSDRRARGCADQAADGSAADRLLARRAGATARERTALLHVAREVLRPRAPERVDGGRPRTLAHAAERECDEHAQNRGQTPRHGTSLVMLPSEGKEDGGHEHRGRPR